ncbi:MAG TPA: phosphoglycerate dehydrogenase [Thermoanaerobaculia bacterium]|nr:phosphoglycerate dehydrogenase [Thermoanaerobaculia bacterium]
MSRIVVAEPVAEAGLELLRRRGHEVIAVAGATREKLEASLAEADALLVRSATKVDAALLAAGPRLQVVARAGVGVDNVDVPAATARGVLVLNAPTANVVSAVEHTFALLLALLRKVPAAAASMASGRWEKSKFLGSELAGKTLGIVGLGQVGSRVAARARAFEAKVVAYDPFLPQERAREMGVPLAGLEELLAVSDIVTLHATAGEKGKPLLGRAEIAAMKPGAILVNVARGSLVDRAALLEALLAGRLAGAALDVFDPEPPAPDDPLTRLENVVASPHLGASTVEAQERVALQTVEALNEALAGASYVPAVNLPFRGPADPSGAAAWMRLAERAARFLSELSGSRLSGLSVETWGLPEDLLRPVAVAAVKGALAGHSPEAVNFVNALHVAHERGLAVSETRHEDPGNYVRSIRVALKGEGRSARADGTLFSGQDARVVAVDDLPLEFRPEGTVVFLRNRDVPGVVGSVGTILGEGGVNIANFSLARGKGSSAAAVIAVDSPPPPAVLERLRKAPAVEDVRVVSW